MCRPGPGAEQGALVTRNIITGTILGQGTLPPGCHATLMPVTCHYCPCNRCHHLMSCVFYLITGESGSELGAGLVVSPCRVQSSSPLTRALHLSPLSFFKVWISQKQILAVETILTEASLCKPCELKKVGLCHNVTHRAMTLQC